MGIGKFHPIVKVFIKRNLYRGGRRFGEELFRWGKRFVERGLNKLSDGRVNPSFSTGQVILCFLVFYLG